MRTHPQARGLHATSTLVVSAVALLMGCQLEVADPYGDKLKPPGAMESGVGGAPTASEPEQTADATGGVQGSGDTTSGDESDDESTTGDSNDSASGATPPATSASTSGPNSTSGASTTGVTTSPVTGDPTFDPTADPDPTFDPTFDPTLDPTDDSEGDPTAGINVCDLLFNEVACANYPLECEWSAFADECQPL